MFGCIVDEGESIDEVTLGCEGPHTFAIHCHGNPLIVEESWSYCESRVCRSCRRSNCWPRHGRAGQTSDAIAAEAKLALTTVKTIEGATIIANQVQAGLSEKIRQWQDAPRFDASRRIAAEAGDILKHSEPARLIISGCTIALVGPPNTGKSTLLNTLAGREKSIVSDIPGHHA